jgi:hypothetical protein
MSNLDQILAKAIDMMEPLAPQDYAVTLHRKLLDIQRIELNVVSDDDPNRFTVSISMVQSNYQAPYAPPRMIKRKARESRVAKARERPEAKRR